MGFLLPLAMMAGMGGLFVASSLQTAKTDRLRAEEDANFWENERNEYKSSLASQAKPAADDSPSMTREQLRAEELRRRAAQSQPTLIGFNDPNQNNLLGS